jgi:hypothetical protein
MSDELKALAVRYPPASYSSLITFNSSLSTHHFQLITHHFLLPPCHSRPSRSSPASKIITPFERFRAAFAHIKMDGESGNASSPEERRARHTQRACGATAATIIRGGSMLNTSYPYMQSSANQFIEMLNHIVEIYTSAVLVIGVLLLVLLCATELQQSRQGRRATRQPQTHRPHAVARRHGARGLLEESSI